MMDKNNFQFYVNITETFFLKKYKISTTTTKNKFFVLFYFYQFYLFLLVFTCEWEYQFEFFIENSTNILDVVVIFNKKGLILTLTSFHTHSHYFLLLLPYIHSHMIFIFDFFSVFFIPNFLSLIRAKNFGVLLFYLTLNHDFINGTKRNGRSNRKIKMMSAITIIELKKN